MQTELHGNLAKLRLHGAHVVGPHAHELFRSRRE
jgi:hypothetical protein